MVALLDALDLPEAAIVGHDFGAEALRDGRAVEVLKGFRDVPVDMSILRRERRLTQARVSRLVDNLLANAPPLSDFD